MKVWQSQNLKQDGETAKHHLKTKIDEMTPKWAGTSGNWKKRKLQSQVHGKFSQELGRVTAFSEQAEMGLQMTSQDADSFMCVII